MDVTSQGSFDPDQRWANSILWGLKSYPPLLLKTVDFVRLVLLSFNYVLQVEKREGKILLTYLDEMDRAICSREKSPIRNSMRKPMTFLEAAVWCQLSQYVQVKLRGMSSIQAKALLAFQMECRADRVRNGLEGRDLRLPDGYTLPEIMKDQAGSDMEQTLKYYSVEPWQRIFRRQPLKTLTIV